jgi:hypothetical protein
MRGKFRAAKTDPDFDFRPALRITGYSIFPFWRAQKLLSLRVQALESIHAQANLARGHLAKNSNDFTASLCEPRLV